MGDDKTAQTNPVRARPVWQWITSGLLFAVMLVGLGWLFVKRGQQPLVQLVVGLPSVLIGTAAVLLFEWRLRPGPGRKTLAGTVIVVIAGVFLGISQLSPVDVAVPPPTSSPIATGAPSTAASTPVSTALVTITSPANRAEVRGDLEVYGTASMPSKFELWLLVQPRHGSPEFVTTTTKPIPIDASGAWVARITIGRGPQDADVAFRLVAVISPTDGGIERHVKLLPKGKRYAHMSNIPSDCFAAAEIEVIRAE